jgi:hypothetical protein
MKKLFMLSLLALTIVLSFTTNSEAVSPVVTVVLLTAAFGFGMLTQTAPGVLMMVAAIDSTRSRAAYQRIAHIVGLLQGKGVQGSDAIIINRDFILSEQVANNNTSTYKFDLWNKTLQNQTPKRPLVKGVVDNDLFMACNARLTLDLRVIGQSNVKVQTFPNEFALGGVCNTVNDLWSIYNSQWFLQVDRIVYVPGDTTRKLLFTPDFNLQDSAGVTTSPTNTLDGRRYYELDPYPIISGRLDNKLTLEVPLYTGWNGAVDADEYAEDELVISWEFDGYTIKNGHAFIEFFNGVRDANNDKDIATFRYNN